MFKPLRMKSLAKSATACLTQEYGGAYDRRSFASVAEEMIAFARTNRLVRSSLL